MACDVSEEELLSGIDRDAPEMNEHLTRCAACQARAAELRAGIEAVTSASQPPAPPLPDRIGSYRIQRRLGAGGMGIVYEAEQQTPRRLVAIKVVRGGQFVDEYRVRLFQREAQTLGRLKHPAIAAIYQADRTDDGQHFFVMELVQGVPLNEYVRDHHIPRSKRLALFGLICDAINYAHQRGVIHRDLKPTNILVDADGRPKILDFGLARIVEPDGASLTTTHDVGRIMGTLPYMSPEEVCGSADQVDVRSDVYSLGVILYELLTDRLPYTVKRTALPDAIRIICEELPKKPSTLDRTLRGDLDTITLKALEKESERRYQSAAALSEDVERYLTDKPVLARRANAMYQLHKFVSRHRLFVTFAIASVMVVLAARIWVDRLEQGRRADIQRNDELLEQRAAIIECDLAELLYADGQFDKAEQRFRNALSNLRRLQKYDKIGPALVTLGTLLLRRENPTDHDYDEAEECFVDALAVLDKQPADRLEERIQALEGLRTLYSPSVWDLPEALEEIEAELLEAPHPK